MNTNDERIKRTLIREKDKGTKTEKAIEAEKALEEKYNGIFGNYGSEMVSIINISTVFNDYKKLYDDLRKYAEQWNEKVICITADSKIDALVSLKALRKVCRKERKFDNNLLLSILKICEVFLCMLSIFQIIYTFLKGASYSAINLKTFILMIIFILAAVIFFSICSLTRKQNIEISGRLKEMSDNELISLFSKLGMKGSYINDEGIFFVENICKLDKLSRCYLEAYFLNVEYIKQLWCIFDYLFEKKIQLKNGNKSIYYESFRLEPLNYEKKLELYNKYNLKDSISKEYLSCIGVDILWFFERNDENTEFKFHSASYISEKLLNVEKLYNSNGDLLRFVYCLAYISSKYHYSFSLDQMVLLKQNGENVERKIKNLIKSANNRLFRGKPISETDTYNFLKCIVKQLDDYCSVETTIKNNKKIKKYRFSYDIVECFRENMEDVCADKQAIEMWILVKLISNEDIFRQDRYFFDCSNLLVMDDSLDNNDFVALAVYFLKLLNGNSCFTYYTPILKKIREISGGQSEKTQQCRDSILEQASINNLFYVSNQESIELVLYFVTEMKECPYLVNVFQNEYLDVIEQSDSQLAGYFKLMYKVFQENVSIYFSFGVDRTKRNIEIEKSIEGMDLYNVITALVLFADDCLRQQVSLEQFEVHNYKIKQMLKKIEVCEEARTFTGIVREMLLWVKSEISLEQDRKYRNINAGMLIEESDSKMLYFIYGLFGMAFLKGKEVILKNDNGLLDFISRSVYYFNVMAYEEGITNYINEIILSRLSIDLKLNMVMRLLITNIPYKQEIVAFAVENIDEVLEQIEAKMNIISNENDLEQYLGEWLLYNSNIKNQNFRDKVWNQILKFIEKVTFCDGSMLVRDLQIILDKKWPDIEFNTIVEEINSIKNYTFAVWVLEGYCRVKEEMLERIPYINLKILCNCGVSLGIELMLRYLMRHGYYDCNHDVLEVFLDIMRHNYAPSEGIILNYLQLIDHYEEDCSNIKQNEFGTYNRLMALLFHYNTVKDYEAQEMMHSFPRRTLEFLIFIIRKSAQYGIQFMLQNPELQYYVNHKITERIPDMENYILKNFLNIKPVVKKGKEMGISVDYYVIINYIYEFPDVYESLLQIAEETKNRVIKKEHVVELINLFLQLPSNENFTGDRESLISVKRLLDSMCFSGATI